MTSFSKAGQKGSIILALVVVYLVACVALFHLTIGNVSDKKLTSMAESWTIRRGNETVDRRAPVAIIAAPASDFCENLDFLVVVKTRTSPNRRDEFRQSYGRRELKEKFRYKLLFPLGFDLNANVSESILEEAKKHGDILQGNFHDRFDTLTEKALLYSRYIASNCRNVSAIVNVDDDVVFNVGIVASYAKEKVTPGSYHCNIFHKGKPIRRNSSKYYLSPEDYPGEHFPDYCSGAVTFYTPLTVQKMVPLAFQANYIFVDDVFVSGMLGPLAGIKLTQIPKEHICACDYSTAVAVKFNKTPYMFARLHRKDTKRLFLVFNAQYLNLSGI